MYITGGADPGYLGFLVVLCWFRRCRELLGSSLVWRGMFWWPRKGDPAPVCCTNAQEINLCAHQSVWQRHQEERPGGSLKLKIWMHYANGEASY